MSNFDIFKVILGILETTEGSNQAKAKIITAFIDDHVNRPLLVDLIEKEKELRACNETLKSLSSPSQAESAND